MAHFKRSRSRLAYSPSSPEGRMAGAPTWWGRVYGTRPARRHAAALCQQILQGIEPADPYAVYSKLPKLRARDRWQTIRG